MLPISKVDNDSRVSSSQDSSHCMLAMILNPSFINKMPGCRLEDPDAVCEHILKLDPWVHSSVNSKKKTHQKTTHTYTHTQKRGSKREGVTVICPERKVTSYIQRNEIPSRNGSVKSSCPTPSFCISGKAKVICPESTMLRSWLGKPEMQFQCPASAISAYSTRTVLARSLYFLCPF